MIEVRELRIGNWVDEDGKHINVYAIDEDGVNGCVNPNDGLEIEYIDAQPIPLTAEWLERLGFEKKAGGISYDKVKLSLYIGDTILSEESGRTYFNSWAILEHTPKFVHQLQNLYFVLTGEEL
jgi:hypothetical protein